MPNGRDEAPTSAKLPWLEELEELEDPAELKAYLAAQPELHRREAIEHGTQEIVRLARQDLARAERLSTAISRLAEIVDDDYGRALDLKARGHLRFLVGDNEEALELYRACQKRFIATGAEVEAAVNLGSSMWMLALLGRYDEAWEDSKRARRTLERIDDPLPLARVITNEANVFLRQDRHNDALERYRSALAIFQDSGEAEDVAVSLHNIAVSSIAINDFDSALEAYRQLGAHCLEHELPLLAAQAEYNIAYLYFFRGEYTRAIEIYQRTRKTCEELGDAYHRALCDLDQAEIYLELNLKEEAARLARLALDAFEELGNRYEAAKALVFLALAAIQRGDQGTALVSFTRAREGFEAEANFAWAAMTDFHLASVHLDMMRPKRARELCDAARGFFADVPWPSREALCEFLLAQIDLLQGLPESARDRSLAALERLEALDLPSLSLKAFVALGRAEEALGDRPAALEAYRRAHALLEDLRTHLGSEETRMAFLSDKLAVYESLVHITLKQERSPENLQRVFGYMEQAKSRILADLVASGGSVPRTSSSKDPELIDKMRQLREELSHHHHELQLLYNLRASSGSEQPGEQASRVAEARAKIEGVNRRSLECEQRLLSTLRELSSRHSDFAALHSAETVGFEEIRASIPANTVLLEYFESRGFCYACVLSADRLDIQPVAELSKLTSSLNLLRNQMSKFQLGEDYLRRFGQNTERTINACLEEIYAALIEPVASLLDGEHLAVVPHGILHQVPFHALRNREGGYLLDRFSFSYAPSASLYSALQKSAPRPHDGVLVLGIPDQRVPEIRGEIEAVAQSLPGAGVFVGEEATADTLRKLGAESRFVHIATHGYFRKDNPMFSAIQLGGSRLTVLDLYELKLEAEMVVLSGCSTGLHRVDNGDELMGLTRGLLYAGAQSVLVTLWDVHDKSTAAFMKSFYSRLSDETNRAKAVGLAMQELRAEYPSPYHWAPFVLIGKHTGLAPV